MAWYVHVSCTFEGCKEDIDEARQKAYDITKNPALLSSSALSKVLYEDQDDYFDYSIEREAAWLIEAILDEKNYNCGPKGELFTWGIVSNHTNNESVVEDISEFFKYLLQNNIIVHQANHIMLFFEHEQSGKVSAYEFRLKEEMNADSDMVTVLHDVPFKWNQY